MAKLQPVFHLSDNPWCAEWHNHFSVSARCKREITWLDSVSDGYRKDDDGVFTQVMLHCWSSLNVLTESLLRRLPLLLSSLWAELLFFAFCFLFFGFSSSCDLCKGFFGSSGYVSKEVLHLVNHSFELVFLWKLRSGVLFFMTCQNAQNMFYWKCHHLLSKMQFPYWFGCNLCLGELSQDTISWLLSYYLVVCR